ncbi:MAG TPA: GxGYxYP family putative glycoside hydrolase, partial [bacterium]|nr:GxGYxYP family putative glycoside hydrolase [bacterium]
MKTQIFLFVLLCAGMAVAGPAGALERTITVMDLSGDWEAEGDLPWQAMLLSLQGLANQHGPHLYFLYPPDYIHPDVRAVLDYYKTRHRMKAVACTTVDEAVAKYVQYAKGYVVWDPTRVPSLMVSFTVAGLEQALVVTEAYIPLAERHGLKPVADFRHRFTDRSDLEIFQWAYDMYWPRCSRDYLIYLGERCTGLNGRPGMMPGIADFGMVHKAFFTDLSASPADPDEYRLADKIMSEMKPYGYVYGWHSYCKDKEPEHLTLLSR